MNHSIAEKITTLNPAQCREVIAFIEAISSNQTQPAKRKRLTQKAEKINMQELEARFTSYKIW